MTTLRIDGQIATVAEGSTILAAARGLGIEIPVLCHSPKLDPVGVCRMCVVDVGGRVLAASCVAACREGMKVDTCSDKVERQRRTLTKLLLADHPTPCAKEQTTEDCELEALGRRYGLLASSRHAPRAVASSLEGTRNVTASAEELPIQHTPCRTGESHRELSEARGRDDSSQVIAVDHQACILCDRCVRACDDIQSNEVIGRTGKGYATRIGFDLDLPMGESTCVSCGECAAACPTGALVHKPITLPLAPASQTRQVASVCPYCGVGCTTTYHVRQSVIVKADGRDSPGSQGRLCVKGRYGWDYALHPHRLTTPLIRRGEHYPKGPLSADVDGRGGQRHRQPPGTPGAVYPDDERVRSAFREATWDEALDLVAARLGGIKREHGPQALAGFGSAKCSNEEAYLFQKLVRAVLGTNNVDHCTRLCHASSVAALMECIGSGAVTDVFGDVAHADLVLLAGTNTTVNHPVAATFFKAAIKRGTRLAVVDPRQSEMARLATWYCRLNPGTDVAFYNALMHVLVEEGRIDHAFVEGRTEGFAELARVIREYPPERVSSLCGVDARTIRELAGAIGAARNMMIFWGMGISQHTHGTDNARSLISLCLLTGQIGRRGTGLHPLRGQNNVQGASDAGLIPMVYPDYQSVDDESIRRRFEQAWGVPLAPRRGLTVVEIMKGALEGSIRGMLMLGENPFLSDPNVNKVRKALSSLEFLAVQDIFLTETAEFADVILPGSSFFEKTGTYTNTDRRVQLGRQVLDPPGKARADWQALCDLSGRLGHPMPYDSPEEVFREFASLTTSYRGLSYESLGETGRIWPIAHPGDAETPVLFADEFPTPGGRARFVAAEFAPAAELPDDEYPLVLNTGRQLEHWHTGTMTRRAQALDALAPEAYVEVHPDDLARFNLEDGQWVSVVSRRGAIHLALRSSPFVPPGSVFIPFHYREAPANVLTIDALDPFGKIPEFKFCAVRLEPAVRED